MPYKILVWIPVEPEDPEIYRTRKEAKKDMESLELMQPENIYKIIGAGKEEEFPQERKHAGK